MIRLKVLKGQNSGAVYELNDEVFIGRADYNDIQVVDETSSRQHAKIKFVNDRFIVSDLGSNNGTFINGKRIQSEVLNPGDNILVGDTLLVFESDMPASRGTSSADKTQDVTVIKEKLSDIMRVETKLGAEELFKPQKDSSKPEDEILYKQLTQLYRATESLSSALTPAEIFAQVLEVMKTSLRIARGYLILIDEKSGTISSIITHELDIISSDNPDLAISRTIINQAIKEGKSLLVSDAREDETLRQRASVVRYKIGSVICVPLRVKGLSLGAIYLESLPDKPVRTGAPARMGSGGRPGGPVRTGARPGGYAFTEEDLRLITALGHQTALALQHSLRYNQFESEVKELKATLAGNFRLIGKSKVFREPVKLANKIAPTNTTVLILGETGTGKELIARLIHEQSPRANKPFVVINCAALVETLLETELFGHEKGAFTGAHEKRKGKFELAQEGTIFLDEIGEISPRLQAKLLRVLEEKQFYSVGGSKPINVDVRIIAATNRPIEEAVRQKNFRDDLYYRLATVTIKMPPLRERKEDIPQLAYYFLEQANLATKKNVQGVSNEAMELLMNYHWPGNIRELRNVIEHGVVLCETYRLEHKDIPVTLKTSPEIGMKISEAIPLNLREAERICIIKALEKTGGKKGEAAKVLGISWPTLNKKIDEYKIG